MSLVSFHGSRVLQFIVLTFAPEFDFRTIANGSSAAVRYANNSNYRNDSLIRKESEWEGFPAPAQIQAV